MCSTQNTKKYGYVEVVGRTYLRIRALESFFESSDPHRPGLVFSGFYFHSLGIAAHIILYPCTTTLEDQCNKSLKSLLVNAVNLMVTVFSWIIFQVLNSRPILYFSATILALFLNISVERQLLIVNCFDYTQ